MDDILTSVLLLAFISTAWSNFVPGFFGQHGVGSHFGGYGSHLGQNHAFNQLGHGHQGGLKHNHNFAHAQGGANVHHEEYHTATHHKYNKEHHEIKHNADKGLEAKAHSHYADAHGASNKVGGNHHYSDKGADGKEVGHATGHEAHGALGSHDAHKSGHHNSFSKHGDASHSAYTAHGAHKAGHYDGNHKDAAYVKHHEIINKEYEDYDHHEAKKKYDKSHKFNTGDNNAAAYGHGYGSYGQSAGDALKHASDQGFKNAYGYGTYAAGKLHQANAAKHGGFTGQHDITHGQKGAAQKGKADENNYYHSVKRKLRKEEHEVKHEDGNHQDAFGGQFAQAGYHQQAASKHAAAAAAVKDNTYHHSNLHHLIPHHQPLVHHGYPHHLQY